jgi:hypothetical protein
MRRSRGNPPRDASIDRAHAVTERPHEQEVGPMKFAIPLAMLVLGLVLSVGTSQAQTWNLQIVDDAGDAGYDSQIVTTADGTPYVFYKRSGDLYLAWWVPGEGDLGGWQFKYLDTYVSSPYAFEALVDAQDRIHVAYGRYTSPGVKYGIYSPSTQAWVLGPETVTGAQTTSYVDLTLVPIGSDLVPVIASNRENDKSYVFKRDPVSGAWSSTNVDPVHNATRGASIAVDSSLNMHASFYEPDGDNLMYATKTWDATTWQVSTVDVTGNVGDYCSILVDASDHVHIVYYDTTNGDLKHATLTP